LSRVQLAPLIIFTMLIAIGHTKVYLFFNLNFTVRNI